MANQSEAGLLLRITACLGLGIGVIGIGSAAIHEIQVLKDQGEKMGNLIGRTPAQDADINTRITRDSSDALTSFEIAAGAFAASGVIFLASNALAGGANPKDRRVSR